MRLESLGGGLVIRIEQGQECPELLMAVAVRPEDGCDGDGENDSQQIRALIGVAGLEFHCRRTGAEDMAVPDARRNLETTALQNESEEPKCRTEIARHR